MRIGVLASQGAFIEHITILKQLGTEAVPVRLPGELRGLDGLIIPGGESTTISLLMNAYDLMAKIGVLAREGLPLFGTCAGMILMAKHITGNGSPSLELMDIRVRRNAFGRQIESFETELAIPALGELPFPAVFIRAPVIEHCGKGVETIARLKDGKIVAAREGKMLVAAFHPELTNDTRFHKYFLDIVSGKSIAARSVDSATSNHR
jgi:pyridoxal 5'-phosphate synthase pdxT subunit